ncbi:hypothetical protein L1987_52700 [Smallanthus sonchifolius]|uniref:Uncharacterized protein n=1 Tax=Smallanthus sonchifolius TaxID=185202 RepID=A0ACB9EUI1_9ASTR|nr:hypothetical protein L1987_52700 [Smallanthus sonchifolius]
MKGRSDCDDWRVPGQKWYQSQVEKRKTVAIGRDRTQSSTVLNHGRNLVYGRSQRGIGDQGRRFTPEREKSGITRGLANLRLDRGVKPVRMKTVESVMVRSRLPVGKSMIRKGKSLKENSRRMSLAKRMKRASVLPARGADMLFRFAQTNHENGEQLDHLDENDLEIKRQSEESYLKGYFEHLDEGLEKENNHSIQEKRGQESSSKMKDKEINDQVKSIKHMVEFLDLLIHEKLVIENKEDFEKGSKNAQDEGKTESEPSIEEYYEVDHDAAMLGNEESKMQIGYEGDKDDSSDDDLVIILN